MTNTKPRRFTAILRDDIQKSELTEMNNNGTAIDVEDELNLRVRVEAEFSRLVHELTEEIHLLNQELASHNW